jgi:hypothetical protein
MNYRSKASTKLQFIIVPILGLIGVYYWHSASNLNFQSTFFFSGLLILWAVYLLYAWTMQQSVSIVVSNGELTQKSFGITRWQVAISEITTIDDAQGKFDLRRVLKRLGRRTSGNNDINYFGFNVKITDGKIYTSPRSIVNYQQFISEIQSINPQIHIGKLTEELNQNIRTSVERPISGFWATIIILGIVIIFLIILVVALNVKNI